MNQQKIRIGEILIKNNAISDKELDQALEKQKITGEKLGKILVDFGFIEHMSLVKYLLQSEIKPTMGEILLAMGIINDSQLEKALQIQKNESHKKIGQIFIELEYITKGMLAQILTIQSKAAISKLNGEIKNNDYTVKGKVAGSILKNTRIARENYEKELEEKKQKELEKNKVITNGFGTIEKEDGSKYIGEIKDGEMHGKGTYSDNLRRYIGEFFNGFYHGEGTMTTLDGTIIHSGKWKNGKPV
ncbi:MAG: hypothetical protein OEZ22_13720 [Spirochaetia bacterium]|nr:hypothetical protein [Spirochaetia bacterium]